MSMTDQEMIKGVVDTYCPPNCDHEPFTVRVIRALLEANVAAMSCLEHIEGRPSIRPYTSFKIPKDWDEVQRNIRT